MLLSPLDAASVAQLPARVQTYIEALVQTCAQDRTPLVSVVLFGSAAKGGFSGNVSDVDVIIIVSDDASRAKKLRLGEGCRTPRDSSRVASSHDAFAGKHTGAHRAGRGLRNLLLCLHAK